MNFAKVEKYFNKNDALFCYKKKKKSEHSNRERRCRVPISSWVTSTEANVTSLEQYRLKGFSLCELFAIGCIYRVALLESTPSSLIYFSFASVSSFLQDILEHAYVTYIGKKLPFSSDQYIFIVCFQPTEGCFLYYKSLCGSLDKENFYLLMKNFLLLYEQYNVFLVKTVLEIKTFSMLVFCVDDDHDESI